MAITYQQAVEFRNGPIGSQIAYVERVLRPSNWNNLNKGLKAKYLGEIERAMNDPYGFALEKLQADVSGLVIYSNTRGGLAAAEAAEREKNVEKSIDFLQQGKQPVEKIQSAVNQGIQTGAASVEEQNARRSEYSVIDRVADIALNLGLGAATAGLSTGAQIAINAAIALEQGAKPEDIARGAIGSILANQFTPLAQGQTTGVSVIDDFNKVIQKVKNTELQSAIFNGVRQGVYATATEQNIAKNVVAGAVAGALATNIQNKYNDPALANAAGEYFQAKIAGKSDIEAAAAAFSGYATEEQKANAKKAVAEEAFNLPLEQRKALGYMTRDEVAGLKSEEVGSFSQAPSEIAAKEEFKTRPGEVGENIIKYTDVDGEVSYRKNVSSKTPDGKDFGYTIVYDDLNGISYEFSSAKEGLGRTITSIKTRPSVENLDTLKTAGSSTTDVSPTNLSVKTTGTQIGQGAPSGNLGASTGTQTKIDINKGTTTAPVTGGAGGAVDTITGATTGGGGGAATGATTGATSGAVSGVTPAEEDGLSLLQRVNNGLRTDASSTGDKKLPPVEVTGDKETILNVPKLPPTEVTYEDETILKPPKIIEDTETTKKTEDTTVTKPPIEPVILDLISGNNFTKTRTRIPTTAERASMQALSQALSVGDPGEALFGSRLGRRKNVWNVESLRLKDELGG